MKILQRFMSVLAILGLFFALGCAAMEVGRKFDKNAAEKIQIGKTNESEVLSLLGQPLKTKINADGTKVFGYAHVESKGQAIPFAAWGSASGDKLIVTFDKNGIVSSLEKTSLPPAQ
jgi:outer membrane protein assembly factor BamE (lipoprotein component of BamABCDE complex)